MPGSSTQGPNPVATGMPNHEALALLPLPDLLSDVQKDGHVCVWGGEALTAATAVMLGSREIDGRTVSPRACRSCVSQAALGFLFDHATGPNACPDCQEVPACDLGQALNRLIRKATR